MHILYAKHTIYGKEMPYIYHIWYNCTAVHSQKLPIIYARCLVAITALFVVCLRLLELLEMS